MIDNLKPSNFFNVLKTTCLISGESVTNKESSLQFVSLLMLMIDHAPSLIFQIYCVTVRSNITTEQ